jgi:hypothetical protein
LLRSLGNQVQFHKSAPETSIVPGWEARQDWRAKRCALETSIPVIINNVTGDEEKGNILQVRCPLV